MTSAPPFGNGPQAPLTHEQRIAIIKEQLDALRKEGDEENLAYEIRNIAEPLFDAVGWSSSSMGC